VVFCFQWLISRASPQPRQQIVGKEFSSNVYSHQNGDVYNFGPHLSLWTKICLSLIFLPCQTIGDRENL